MCIIVRVYGRIREKNILTSKLSEVASGVTLHCHIN